MKDYRLTIKVRNNRLLKAIESVGGKPGIKWCEANGLVYTSVNDLINMTSSPLNKNSGLSSTAARLCEVLEKLPEELWSNKQLYPLERNFSELEMNYAQVVAMLPAEQQSYLPDFSSIEEEQTKTIVAQVLSTLSSREQAVIKMRFEEELTLEGCGKQLGMSRERIREIEARALRKLRNPKRANILKNVLDI